MKTRDRADRIAATVALCACFVGLGAFGMVIAGVWLADLRWVWTGLATMVAAYITFYLSADI